MDEAKAAAYYDELSRKGSGAARFKQGLGFTSQPSSDPPKPGHNLPSSSSFHSTFVRASSPSKASELEKKSRIESVHNKLAKKDRDEDTRGHRRDRDEDRERSCRDRRSRSMERDGRKRRERSRSREGDRRRSREREERRRERERGDLRGSLRRSRSPERRRHGREGKGSAADYSRLIEGYSQMSPAERVKAKMKLQLKETSEKDAVKGTNSRWERFDFDKDAPLDDEEIEVAEDDAALVKDIGQTFRFAAVEAKREDEIKAAHDQAMFGAPVARLPQTEEPNEENDQNETADNPVESTLISDNLVSAMIQGSWRDRVRRSK